MEIKPYYSIREVAEIVGKSRIAIYYKVKDGTIPSVRVGRSFAIPFIYVQKFISELSEADKKTIDAAVEKVVKEYGETLRLLGKEEWK